MLSAGPDAGANILVFLHWIRKLLLFVLPICIKISTFILKVFRNFPMINEGSASSVRLLDACGDGFPYKYTIMSRQCTNWPNYIFVADHIEQYPR